MIIFSLSSIIFHVNGILIIIPYFTDTNLFALELQSLSITIPIIPIFSIFLVTSSTFNCKQFFPVLRMPRNIISLKISLSLLSTDYGYYSHFSTSDLFEEQSPTEF